MKSALKHTKKYCKVNPPAYRNRWILFYNSKLKISISNIIINNKKTYIMCLLTIVHNYDTIWITL